ncbi:hypothetical protein REH65_32320 [Saccharopolyspora sp. ID03-671]|uniref:hypothetical protein n=1 Tax=Saccharopolyspora sp. ID03-671 TaxID=3073066 RepID=UPI0032479785
MSNSVTLSDAVLSVAALLRAGDLDAARRQWHTALATAQEVETATLRECGRILAAYPRTATPHLRRLWQRTSDERARAVIAACAPLPNQQPTPGTEASAAQAPRWDRRSIEHARAQHRTGGTVRTHIDADQRRTRTQQRQAAQELAARLDHTDTTDDRPQRQDTGSRPDGWAIDYDLMAINPVAHDPERPDPRQTAVAGNGRPCVAVGCHVEPSRADRQHQDGLCQECRDADRPGIQVPENASRAQRIEALCAYIWQHYPGGLDHLRREWARYSSETDRATVATWVKTHVPKAIPDLTTCEQCPSVRQIRNGLCLDCRRLDEEDMPSLAAVRNHPTATPADDESTTVGTLVGPLSEWAADQHATAAA